MAYIEGLRGEVRVGGRTAARLGSWVYEGLSTEWRCDAELLEHNPLWLAGTGPFELRLAMVTGGWRWKGVHVEQVGAALIIRGTSRWERYGP